MITTLVPESTAESRLDSIMAVVMPATPAFLTITLSPRARRSFSSWAGNASDRLTPPPEGPVPAVLLFADGDDLCVGEIRGVESHEWQPKQSEKKKSTS
jgi:hypothetical protein